MLKGRTLIALAAVVLAQGRAWQACADPTDDRDRSATVHTRDRNTARARTPSGSAPEVPAALPVTPQDPQLACDRACLQAVAENYLKAVVAHDPKLLT